MSLLTHQTPTQSVNTASTASIRASHKPSYCKLASKYSRSHGNQPQKAAAVTADLASGNITSSDLTCEFLPAAMCEALGQHSQYGCKCMHRHAAHACTHARMHTACMHTRIQHTCTHVHTHINAYIHTLCIDKHIHMHAHTHARTHARTHAHTYACHTYTHTIHAHTHTLCIATLTHTCTCEGNTDSIPPFTCICIAEYRIMHIPCTTPMHTYMYTAVPECNFGKSTMKLAVKYRESCKTV